MLLKLKKSLSAQGLGKIACFYLHWLNDVILFIFFKFVFICLKDFLLKVSSSSILRSLSHVEA